MANKFDNPNKAYNECSDYGGQLKSCVGQFGTLTEMYEEIVLRKKLSRHKPSEVSRGER